MPKLTRDDVELWWKTMATGEVHYTKVLDGRVTPEIYPRLRQIHSELAHEKDPVIEACGRRDGYYRLIEPLPDPINFAGLSEKLDSKIILPFNLREYAFIYNQTIILVAGAKSSGKTGFLYRTAGLNMSHLNVILLSNLEGGAEQMKDRFLAMGIPLDVSPIKVYPLNTENAHHLMKFPDSLYIIDYIDCPEGGEFYLIAGKISRINQKLKILGKSVAIIGLQKPPGRDLAFGGAGTLKDATLYLAMDKKRLKIVDCKVPAQEFSPNNMIFRFTYSETGTRFDNVKSSFDEPIGDEIDG